MTRDRTAFLSPAAEYACSRESVPPPEFGELARLAADVFQAPLASIVLTGWSESWFSAGVLSLRALPDNPFLAHTLAAVDVFEVPEIAADPRFAGADQVLEAAGIRSYAGCALRTAAGEVLGAIAIYRTRSAALSAGERSALAGLARQGAALAELHARVSELELLSAAEHGVPRRPIPAFALADSLLDTAPVAIYYVDTQSEAAYVNPEYRRMFRLARDAGRERLAAGRSPR